MSLEHVLDLLQAPHMALGALSSLIGLALVTYVIRTPWFIGLTGELKLRMITRFQLDAAVYHAIHDITLPTPGGTTQIDHVLVSRYGVFVIETKNMKGRIYGRAGDRLWTQSIYRRRHSFLNPLRQNFKHVKAIEAVLGLESWHLHSIVVFVGSATLELPSPPNVVRIRDFVPTVLARTRVVLSDTQVQEAISRLNRNRIPRLIANWVHLRNLRRRRSAPADVRAVGPVENVASRRSDPGVAPRIWS